MPDDEDDRFDPRALSPFGIDDDLPPESAQVVDWLGGEIFMLDRERDGTDHTDAEIEAWLPGMRHLHESAEDYRQELVAAFDWVRLLATADPQQVYDRAQNLPRPWRLPQVEVAQLKARQGIQATIRARLLELVDLAHQLAVDDTQLRRLLDDALAHRTPCRAGPAEADLTVVSFSDARAQRAGRHGGRSDPDHDRSE